MEYVILPYLLHLELLLVVGDFADGTVGLLGSLGGIAHLDVGHDGCLRSAVGS